MVAADDREWGLECPGVTIDVGEELGEAGQRRWRNNTNRQKLGLTGAGKAAVWQNLAISLDSLLRGLKGDFELLRNLVASQKMGKEKGILTVSKSEWELRRLRNTINYNGNKTNKGGGRTGGTYC